MASSVADQEAQEMHLQPSKPVADRAARRQVARLPRLQLRDQQIGDDRAVWAADCVGRAQNGQAGLEVCQVRLARRLLRRPSRAEVEKQADSSDLGTPHVFDGGRWPQHYALLLIRLERGPVANSYMLSKSLV